MITHQKRTIFITNLRDSVDTCLVNITWHNFKTRFIPRFFMHFTTLIIHEFVH